MHIPPRDNQHLAYNLQLCQVAHEEHMLRVACMLRAHEHSRSFCAMQTSADHERPGLDGFSKLGLVDRVNSEYLSNP